MIKYFTPASYEASMSLNNEVLTEKLKNENSPEFLQLSRDTCVKVCTLTMPGLGMGGHTLVLSAQ